jgi:hypothetical protein
MNTLENDFIFELNAILAYANEYPREDILYECSVRIGTLLYYPDAFQLLGTVDYTSSPISHATVLRGLGDMSRDVDLRLPLMEAGLKSESIEVRDAAVSALMDLQDGRAVPLLKAALEAETSDLIREAIEDALEQLIHFGR